MDIKIGDYDVYRDGTVIGNENEPIDFVFNKETGFIVRIVFASDPAIEGTKVSAKKFDKIGGELTFYNFNNSLGHGNLKPVTIGKLKSRELLLNYRIYSLSKGAKTFHYTWLLGKEAKNG